MTSKIIVNNIEADTGISTVTFNSNISVSTATITNVNATRISGVSTAGITTAYIGSINDGALSGARNRIINGDMRISQRGSINVTSGGGNTYVAADRFTLTNYWGSGQVNTGINTSIVPTGFTNSLSLTVNTAPPMSGSTGYAAVLWQAIEGFNISDAYNSNVTLSFWVRSSITGTYSVTLSNVTSTAIGDGSRIYVTNYTISAANTWEKKTITVNLSPGYASGTWDITNGNGLCIGWNLGSESNRKGNSYLNTWSSVAPGVYEIQSGSQTNWITNSGATFYITGVQLEPGTVATPFERRSYAQELSLSRRYFTRIYDPPMRGVGTGGTVGGASRLCLFFPQSMRVPPTLTITGTFNFWNGSNTATGGTLSGYFQGGYDGIDLDITTSGSFTIGQAVCAYCTNNTTNKYVDLNSEL